MAVTKRQKIVIRLAIVSFIIFLGFLGEFIVYRYQTNRSVLFRTDGGRIQIYREKRWRTFIVKGINFSYAGSAADEEALPKSEYKRWLKQMADMNANVIRVKSILPRPFYQAFLEYNLLADKPLYLLQGIWTDDDSVQIKDAYDDRLNTELFEKIKETVDAVNGNAEIRRSGSAVKYKHNVSRYLMGYFLSGGYDPDFVITTNENNTKVMGFEGDYLYSQNASPYEAWLAALGNFIISYSNDNYGFRSILLSWISQPATDPIDHLSMEDLRREAAAGVILDHIYNTEKLNQGIFLSYIVSPQNPDFLKFRGEYSRYMDSRGKLNPFEAYLKALGEFRTMPLVAVEFGGQEENERGEAVADAFESIISAGFSGGTVFSWQHDWLRKYREFDQSDGKTDGIGRWLADVYASMQEKYGEH